mgnify:FL=1
MECFVAVRGDSRFTGCICDIRRILKSFTIPYYGVERVPQLSMSMLPGRGVELGVFFHAPPM